MGCRPVVDGADDGIDALAWLEHGHCDLVLTDVVMPRMGGIALAGEVERRHPQIAVAFTSGYPRHEAGRGLAELPGPLLPKPFGKKALLGFVDEVASGNDPRPVRRHAGA